MRALLLFLLACLVIDASWYMARLHTIETSLKKEVRQAGIPDPGMVGTGEDNRWFDTLPLTTTAGDVAFYSVGTVHAHVTECPVPDSESFSCVKASWERRFKEALGTHTEYCAAILAKEIRDICETALTKNIDDIHRLAPLMWRTKKNPGNLPDDEFLDAVSLMGEVMVKMQNCPSHRPGLSKDCLEAEWQLEFNKRIPPGKERYCGVIENKTFNRLCRTGAALPPLAHI